MPVAAPRPCKARGCARLAIEYGFCADHVRNRNQSRTGYSYSTEKRATRTERGYSNTWLRASKAFRLANPLCVRCIDQGKLTSAEVVDHIVPHKGDPERFWDQSNWQSLCKRCHDAKTAREDAPAHSMPEWMPTPTCRVTLVCGPPGSGKSTLVAQQAQPEDTVIDLDLIISELSGLPLYQASNEWLARGLRERNRRLAHLSRMPAEHRAWVIVTGPLHKRNFWCMKLQPENVLVLAVEDHECELRILSDPRRESAKQRHLAAVKAWWAHERAGAGGGRGQSLGAC